MKKILALILVSQSILAFAGGLECQKNGTCECQANRTCDEEGNPIDNPTVPKINEIDYCSNKDYQISIRSTNDGWLNALLLNSNSVLLAQYQVHFDTSIDNYIGHGFKLYTFESTQSTNGRIGNFHADLATTGQTINGRIVCNPRKQEQEPPGKPKCHPWQVPVYENGQWRCVKGDAH